MVQMWMVCCACFHARMMRVGMMCRGFCLLAVFAVASDLSYSGFELFASEASASYVDLSAWDVSAVTNMEQSAPHDTPPRSTHVEPFAKYGVSNVPRAAGG